MKYRIATHECMTVSPIEIDRAWSIDDVCEAHTVLDELDNARAQAAKS